tara:strand:+ start:373 stop:591 length:219 start_codon:yes stop_codon:yes gene_type:complete
MPDKLKSRKFWFALLGALLPIIAQYFSSEVDLSSAIQLSSGVVVAYLFGQGYVDGKAVEGVSPSAPPATEEG